jgi:hypothetical protein
MKILMTSAAAAALAMSLGGSATAQNAPIGENSMRPLDITCVQLKDASPQEQVGMSYFIAGFLAGVHEAMAAAGQPGEMSTGSTAGGASGGTTGQTTGGSTDQSAGMAGGTAQRPAGASPDATAGTSSQAAAGTTAGSAAGGTSGSAGGRGEVPVPRKFFAMSGNEILAACEANPDMTAAQAVSTAAQKAQQQ